MQIKPLLKVLFYAATPFLVGYFAALAALELGEPHRGHGPGDMAGPILKALAGGVLGFGMASAVVVWHLWRRSSSRSSARVEAHAANIPPPPSEERIAEMARAEGLDPPTGCAVSGTRCIRPSRPMPHPIRLLFASGVLLMLVLFACAFLPSSRGQGYGDSSAGAVVYLFILGAAAVFWLLVWSAVAWLAFRGMQKVWPDLAVTLGWGLWALPLVVCVGSLFYVMAR